MVACAEFTNGNNHAIDVSGLAPGAYVIRIYTGGEMIREMFIKN